MREAAGGVEERRGLGNLDWADTLGRLTSSGPQGPGGSVTPEEKIEGNTRMQSLFPASGEERGEGVQLVNNT